MRCNLLELILCMLTWSFQVVGKLIFHFVTCSRDKNNTFSFHYRDKASVEPDLIGRHSRFWRKWMLYLGEVGKLISHRTTSQATALIKPMCSDVQPGAPALMKTLWCPLWHNNCIYSLLVIKFFNMLTSKPDELEQIWLNFAPPPNNPPCFTFVEMLNTPIPPPTLLHPSANLRGHHCSVGNYITT